MSIFTGNYSHLQSDLLQKLFLEKTFLHLAKTFLTYLTPMIHFNSDSDGPGDSINEDDIVRSAKASATEAFPTLRSPVQQEASFAEPGTVLATSYQSMACCNT